MKRNRRHARSRPTAARGDRRPLDSATRAVPPVRPLLGTTVAGLARAAGVTPHVVRHYTRIGLLEPLRDPNNAYKRFNGQHLARLKFIRGAQTLGYTLAEIRRIFEHADRGSSPCPEVRDILRCRLAETREHVCELQRLEQRMERALRTWAKMKDGTPDGHSVCALIESTLDGASTEFVAARGGTRTRNRSGDSGKRRK